MPQQEQVRVGEGSKKPQPREQRVKQQLSASRRVAKRKRSLSVPPRQHRATEEPGAQGSCQ